MFIFYLLTELSRWYTPLKPQLLILNEINNRLPAGANSHNFSLKSSKYFISNGILKKIRITS
jgi:hypothetical protein